MADILTAVETLAIMVFRESRAAKESGSSFEFFLSDDAVLREAQRQSHLSFRPNPKIIVAIDEVAKAIFSEPALQSLANRDGELEPMALHPGGGARISATNCAIGLLSSAFLQMYFLRLSPNEDTFARTVLAGFEELRRAVKEGRTRAYAITGIAGVTLPEGTQISTPWGTVRPAPPVYREPVFSAVRQRSTTCILAECRMIPIKFDRSPSPQHSFDAAEAGPGTSSSLFPLACALASKETAKPIVPVLTWDTLIVPFVAAFGHSIPLLVPTLGSEAELGDMIEHVEKWASIVGCSHAASVDIASRRLVSAVANRIDRADALIDAVMVWENLVGTGSEVSFRVTAALAKLVEMDVTKRRDCQKALAKIYGIRSRVVHGEAVDLSDVDKACSDAIEVAVRALQASYRRGRHWLELSSSQRSDALLLAE